MRAIGSTHIATALGGLGLLLAGVGVAGPDPAPVRKVDFNRDVLPILSEHCFRCHGPDAAAVSADLRLDQYATATADRGGYRAIEPGSAERSRVYQRLTADVESLRMPPMASGVAPLTTEQVETIRLWIESGAEYKPHWAFVPPAEPERPRVSDPKWPRQELDWHVLAALDEAGLEPAPEADLRTLARRAALTLTGLPPSPEEVERLLKDKDYGAYVDRLLASPRYGEHQARYWLDAVRYGDTHGLHLDNERSIWPYRDWVVRALNADLPFDEFALWQIAGDMLREPTTEQLIASGYVRMNPTTAEGGAIEEEFLVKNTFDRVDTFGTVFLGLTVGCAKCHDHKYDPLTQKEYYGLFAYFNSTADAPLDGNALAPPPAIKAPTPAQERELEAMKSSLRTLEDAVPRETAQDWIKSARVAPPVFGAWEVSPVYTAADFDAAHATAFDPETKEVEWKPTDVALGRLKAEIIKVQNSAVYLRTKVQSESDNEIVVRLGSDDSIKLWANGTLVHDNKVLRALAPDQDSVKVPLRKGQNTLLVKIVNAAGGDGFYAAYGDPRAERIDRAFKSGDARELATVFLTYGPASPASEKYRATMRQVADFEAALPLTLVAKELETPRETRLLRRGEYDQKGEVVERHLPAILGGAAPKDRLELARWLVRKDNTLLARVTVNRVWLHHFGTAIVQSAENFGVQGDWPNNPALLDQLATEFVADGWSMKRLHKRIVTSAAFMQSSVVTKQKLERDPENLLVSRGPRFRLDAEVLRDQALFVSGTLVEKLGGKGVKTYQPEGLWEAVAYPTSNTSKYVQDHGEALYRRSLYLFWKRTSPPPTMSVFDAPTREACIVNRSRTNTPLQALVVMNGTQFVEASRNLAQRVIRAGASDRERVARLFLLATGRPVTDVEAKIVLETLALQRQEFRADAEAAKKLLAVGESPRDETIPADEHAAWAMVCNMVLNLDEVVTQH